MTAALAFLQKQPEVDAARTGILGHSEGGLLALSAASAKTNAAKPPVMLVLAATPGRALDAVIKEQLVHFLRVQGATREQTQFFLDKNAALSAAIKKTGQVPADVPPGLATLYPSYLGKFLRRSLSLNPAGLATAFPGPVLILQGEADVQISPTADARALDASCINSGSNCVARSR